MKLVKQTSMVLALAIISAGVFCFAECAYAQPMQCHGNPETKDRTPHEAGALCCPSFEAPHHSHSKVVLTPNNTFFTDSSDFQSTSTGSVLRPRLYLYLPSDLSPPRIFLMSYAVHAPPSAL